MSSELWGSSFGDSYHERNARAGDGRWPFWRDFYQRWPVNSVLEVGCGNGANLKWAVTSKVTGMDVNEGAILAAKAAVPHGSFIVGSARSLPLPDRSYELVFTAGLLIHIPPIDLPKTMDELWRVSSKYLLIMEYDASHETMIEYRGKMNLLWKRPYSGLFADRFGLDNLARGFVGKDRGFDSLHWDLWRKRP